MIHVVPQVLYYIMYSISDATSHGVGHDGGIIIRSSDRRDSQPMGSPSRESSADVPIMVPIMHPIITSSITEIMCIIILPLRPCQVMHRTSIMINALIGTHLVSIRGLQRGEGHRRGSARGIPGVTPKWPDLGVMP